MAARDFCKLYPGKFQQALQQKAISIKQMHDKHGIGYDALHRAKNKNEMTLYSLKKLCDVLRLPMEALADLSGVRECLLRRVKLGVYN